MNFYKSLKIKIKEKKAKIVVVGLGIIGKSVFESLINKKLDVKGYDINRNILYKFKKKSYREKIFINNYAIIKNSDIIIICLPTWFDTAPNMKILFEFFRKIKKFIKEGHFIIIESTVLPGTSKKIFKTFFKKNYNIGKNLFFGYVPERLDLGNTKYNLKNTTRIISGISKNCLNLTYEFYNLIVRKTTLAPSTEYAEFTKLFENVYRGINITFVNEINGLLKKTNLNTNIVVNLAKTKPFGYHAFYPGNIIGGSCITNNMNYLNWYGKKNDYRLNLLNYSINFEKKQKIAIIKKIKNNIQKINVKKILIIGLSYKKNVSDLRNSVGEIIINHLNKNKINFDVHDNFVLPSDYLIGKKNIKLNKNNIKKYDLVILAQLHSYLKKDIKNISNYSKNLINFCET